MYWFPSRGASCPGITGEGRTNSANIWSSGSLPDAVNPPPDSGVPSLS